MNNTMKQVSKFKKQFQDRQLITDIINKYGDYPNDSFIDNGLCIMFIQWYNELVQY